MVKSSEHYLPGNTAQMVSPERRLQAVYDTVEGLARVGIKCFTHFAPSEPFEGSFSQFMRFVEQVPVVADWWNRSSARQGLLLRLPWRSPIIRSSTSMW